MNRYPRQYSNNNRGGFRPQNFRGWNPSYGPRGNGGSNFHDGWTAGHVAWTNNDPRFHNMGFSGQSGFGGPNYRSANVADAAAWMHQNSGGQVRPQHGRDTPSSHSGPRYQGPSYSQSSRSGPERPENRAMNIFQGYSRSPKGRRKQIERSYEPILVPVEMVTLPQSGLQQKSPPPTRDADVSDRLLRMTVSQDQQQGSKTEEEKKETRRNDDGRSNLERNAVIVDNDSRKSNKTDVDKSPANRPSKVVDQPQNNAGQLSCHSHTVTAVSSTPSVSVEAPVTSVACQEASKTKPSKSELKREDFGLAAKMNPVTNSSQKSETQGGVCEKESESKALPSENKKAESKGGPSFTRAPVTYKEYKEAKLQREKEEQRKKAEASKKVSPQNLYQRHHSLTSLPKQSPTKKGPAHIGNNKRSVSLDMTGSSKTGSISPSKSPTVYQHSSYFGHEPVNTGRRLSGENLQRPPLRSECSSFSTYKRDIHKEKVNISPSNKGNSMSTSNKSESSEDLVSEGGDAGKIRDVLEHQCSRDEHLPGIEVPGRNSHKTHVQSKEGFKSVSDTSGICAISSQRSQSSDNARHSSQENVGQSREKEATRQHSQEKSSEVSGEHGQGSHREDSSMPSSQKDTDVSQGRTLLYKRQNSNSRDVSDLAPVVEDQDEEICKYGSDHDIDMDDSDDDELEAPDFLQDLENAWRRPVPGTPPPRMYGSPVHSGSPVPMGSIMEPPRVPNTKFSLDDLLAEEIDKTQDQVEMEEIHARLERDVRMGGFVKDTLEKEKPKVEGELLPEQQAQIQQLEVLETVLRQSHPGQKIFSGEHHQHLFTPSLSPQDCGFTPGSSYIDKHLATLQPANYNDLFTSHLLMECLQAVSNPSAILRWIFLYMSTEKSSLAVNGCFDVLEEYYYCQKHFNEDKHSWCPSVGDVLSALCNFGCDPGVLLPSQFLSTSIKNSMLPQQQNVQAVINNGSGLQVENLRLMLVTLTYALQSRSRYKAEDLTHLLFILCCTALDEHLCSELLTLELQCCIGAIVEKYKDKEWELQAPVLCRAVPWLTDHHHNMVYLCSLFPLVPRGTFLQNRVSYLCLRRLFGMEASDVDLDTVKLKCLHKFPPLMRDLVDSDIYRLSSCLNLMDKCIGCGTVKLAEKDDLYNLTDYIKKMAGEIRENVRMLDKSRLKDLMVRLTSKWTMLMIACGSSQKTLFAYAKVNPQKIKIETVQASQSDAESEQSDQSETEMEYTEVVDN